MENIIELKLGVTPEAAVSGALLLQSEYKTFLTFNAMKDTNKPSPYGGYYKEEAGTAIVEFPFCLVSKFGHPNDEAAGGIPKYKDLEIAYAICEVENSDWINEVEELNNHQFPGTDYSYLKHYLIFFHDSTFECIADEINLRISKKPYSEIFKEISNEVGTE